MDFNHKEVCQIIGELYLNSAHHAKQSSAAIDNLQSQLAGKDSQIAELLVQISALAPKNAS